MCSTSIIGSNCCGCDSDDSNFIRFNCNEITNNSKDFSMDLSDILIKYSDIDKRGFTLEEMNSDGDFSEVDFDFLVYKSKLPLSLYGGERKIFNINLLAEIVEIVEEDYYIDVKYKIKKILSENYGSVSNNGDTILTNQSSVLTRMFYDGVSMPSETLENDVLVHGTSNKFGEYYVIEEKTKRIPKDIDEVFDLSTYSWFDEFIVDDLTFKIELSVANAGTVSETYLNGYGEGGAPVFTTQDVIYSSRWLKILNATFNMSDSVYNFFSLKHSPVDMITIRNANSDTTNSYYSIVIFYHYKRIGLSNFGMLPLTNKLLLVNENEQTNKVDVIGLTL